MSEPVKKDQLKESQELTVKYQLDGCDIILTPSIVQKYLVSGGGAITIQDFKMFSELCKARHLNPFLSEVYCIKYGDKPAKNVVSKDVFIKRAILHPQYDGKEAGILVIDKKGELIERQGLMYLPDEKVVGGWARVFRKDKTHPEFVSVSLEEVADRKADGRFNGNWEKKPATMVEKVAKVRALREAFTDEFSGMDVMPEDVEATVVDIIPIPPSNPKEISGAKAGEKRTLSLNDI